MSEFSEELVEQAARALCEATGMDPDHWHAWKDEATALLDNVADPLRAEGAAEALGEAADDIAQYADRRGETAGCVADWDNPTTGGLAVGKVNGLDLAVDRLRAREAVARIEGGA